MIFRWQKTLRWRFSNYVTTAMLHQSYSERQNDVMNTFLKYDICNINTVVSSCRIFSTNGNTWLFRDAKVLSENFAFVVTHNLMVFFFIPKPPPELIRSNCCTLLGKHLFFGFLHQNFLELWPAMLSQKQLTAFNNGYSCVYELQHMHYWEWQRTESFFSQFPLESNFFLDSYDYSWFYAILCTLHLNTSSTTKG